MSAVTSNNLTMNTSMCLKLDLWTWSCNLLAFDRESKVLLCKDDSTGEMVVVIQDVTEVT